MQRHWNDHELETSWSFSSDEFTLIPQRDASSRLGVAASLKFFQLEGYFPSSSRDIPAAALDYMAKQLAVEPNAILAYDWQGRTGKRYRGRLRTALGIRLATAEDFTAVETWLREEVVPWDHPLRVTACNRNGPDLPSARFSAHISCLYRRCPAHITVHGRFW